MMKSEPGESVLKRRLTSDVCNLTYGDDNNDQVANEMHIMWNQKRYVHQEMTFETYLNRRRAGMTQISVNAINKEEIDELLFTPSGKWDGPYTNFFPGNQLAFQEIIIINRHSLHAFGNTNQNVHVAYEFWYTDRHSCQMKTFESYLDRRRAGRVQIYCVVTPVYNSRYGSNYILYINLTKTKIISSIGPHAKYLIHNPPLEFLLTHFLPMIYKSSRFKLKG